jgi:hypothetical protein
MEKLKKNLIISPIGDDSVHLEWFKGDSNFDAVFLYYGDNQKFIDLNLLFTPHVHKVKGVKYHLIKNYIDSNLNFITKYDYVWLPDNDVSISTNQINKLFEIAEKYKLLISQPSMDGYVSHEITKPTPNSILRYTNFVEVLAPLFNTDTLLKVYNTFDLNFSSWGYDFLWPYILGYPENKIAIIDDVVMTHTKPIGTDYSRFPTCPSIELGNLLHHYNLTEEQITYSQILKN